MNKYIDDKLLEKVKLKIAISNCKREIKQGTDMNTLKNKEKRRIFVMKKKIIATACASLVLVSGIAFAINSKKVNDYDRGLDQRIETAIKNGYVANPEMDFINFDDKGTKVKMENFFMDDLNLSVKFLLEFDENIKSTIDLKNVYRIELNDLIVRDEENRIIFAGNSIETFNEYCKENNLDYKFGEINENYMNCGLNTFIEKEDENIINLMYNIYSDKFPKSNKLYFSFKTISLYTIPAEQGIKYELKGYWNVEIDVPENMYNRTTEYYKVVSCDDSDFNVYTSFATNTGFEIGLIVPTESKEELIIDRKRSYVENERGEKFSCSVGVSRKAKNDFLEGNKYDFYETFNMTKYDTTDKIKVILYYYENPITIELQRVK